MCRMGKERSASRTKKATPARKAGKKSKSKETPKKNRKGKWTQLSRLGQRRSSRIRPPSQTCVKNAQTGQLSNLEEEDCDEDASQGSISFDFDTDDNGDDVFSASSSEDERNNKSTRG